MDFSLFPSSAAGWPSSPLGKRTAAQPWENYCLQAHCLEGVHAVEPGGGMAALARGLTHRANIQTLGSYLKEEGIVQPSRCCSTAASEHSLELLGMMIWQNRKVPANFQRAASVQSSWMRRQLSWWLKSFFLCGVLASPNPFLVLF